MDLTTHLDRTAVLARDAQGLRDVAYNELRHTQVWHWFALQCLLRNHMCRTNNSVSRFLESNFRMLCIKVV